LKDLLLVGSLTFYYVMYIVCRPILQSDMLTWILRWYDQSTMKLLKKSVLTSWILFLAATATFGQGWCSFSRYRFV